MKQTIYVNDFMQAFRDMGRDYYSYHGYHAMFEFYEELDPDMEMDVIAICCDWTEYDDEGLISGYGYVLDRDEDMDDDDYLTALLDALNDETTAINLDNGNYLILAF